MVKRWLIGVGGVLAVLVVGLLIAALAFDPNAEKGRIIAAVRRATGRDLVLAGQIRVVWGLTPLLTVEDAALANMASGSRPQMATVGRLEAQVRLLPLLSRRVEIDSVTLQRPDILLETDAAGQANWHFERPAAPPGPASTPSGQPRTGLVLHSLRLQDGRVAWRDGATGQAGVIDVAQATIDLDDNATRVLADGTMDGQPIKLDATLGGQAQLNGTQPGPFPVKLGLDAGSSHFSAQGSADPVARQFTGTVQAAIPDVSALRGLLPLPPLPPLRDVRLSAEIATAGSPQVRSGNLHVGMSDLSKWLPGASVTRLDASWVDGQPARVDAVGTAAGGPWTFGAGVVPAAGGIGLRGMSLVTAAGDVAGDAALGVDAAGRPWLRGTLVSGRIDADQLKALRRPAAPLAAPAVPAAPAASVPAGPAEPGGTLPAHVFSDMPLDWAVLRGADLDLQLTVGTLRLGGADYRQAAAHVALKAGVLQINPASLQSPGGRLEFSVGADASQPAPPLQLNLRAAGLALDPLLQAAGLPGGSDAALEVDASLQSAGLSPHQLASHLNGHLGLALVDGQLSNAVLIAALGDVLRNANAGLDPNGRSEVRCLAVRLNAADGVVTVAALKLDTSRLLLEGAGTVDLGSEMLALRLRPLVRLGGAGVLAPVKLDGSLLHPIAALDALGAAGRVGVVIGGSVAPDNCAADLAAARDGRAGPLPAAAKTGGKPADLLRQLLR